MVYDERMVFMSEGDVEIAILHENKNAFASIINKDLYKVLGDKPNQEIRFHNEAALDLFCIRTYEFFSEKEIRLPQSKNLNLSLFSGVEWIIKKHSMSDNFKDLVTSIEKIKKWLEVKNDFSIWNGLCHFEFAITRRKMIKYASLVSKHSLFSITGIIQDLHEQIDDPDVSKMEVVDILKTFEEELKDTRLNYLAAQIIEMLFEYFVELNEFIRQFYGAPKNDEFTEHDFPKGSSDWYWNMHTTTLNFASGYSKDYYGRLNPQVGENMKKRF